MIMGSRMYQLQTIYEKRFNPTLTKSKLLHYNNKKTFNYHINMKYNEDKIIKEISDYISNTYTEHYSTTKDRSQVQDMLRHPFMIKTLI